MCEKCKKLFELYAETQLECVKNNKYISKIIIDKCLKCGNNIYIAAQITENNTIGMFEVDESRFYK